MTESNATKSSSPASRVRRPLLVLALATGALFAAGGSALASDDPGQIELQIVDRSANSGTVQQQWHSPGDGNCPEKSSESGNV